MLIVAIMAVRAESSTATFNPAADAFVRSDRATSNFGTASKLTVDGSPAHNILLRFTVSGVGANTVTSAKLRLFNTNKSAKGGDFYRVADNTWTESTVTWNTAPAADPTPFASLGSVVINTWYEVNLSFVTGDGTYSLRVKSTSSDGADYSSREGAVGRRPELVLTVAASDTTAPSASITSPTNGSTVSGSVPVQIDASDNVGVTKVELRVDGSLHGTDTAAPYTFNWDSAALANGDHGLVAVAYDAAGNTGTSSTVTVAVENVLDTTNPTAPTNLAATAIGPTRVDLTWTASTDEVGVTGYRVFRDGSQIGTSSTPTYSDTTASPGATFEYFVKAYDAAGNVSPPSETAFATTPIAPTTFVFAAAGDHGTGGKADGSLAALDGSGASFYLALGDLDYNNTQPDSAWCDYVKSKLPTLGPNFPFQLTGGNHEQQGGPDGYILNFAACLPDRMGSTLSPTNQYAAEYFFDYPSGAPLMRVIEIAPDLVIENVTYDYFTGNSHYSWLAGVIDDARASGIPWVVVGMHKVCLTTGSKWCEIGADLMNLLIEKKVDLVLQGHDHNYQRGKQLGLNALSCPAVPILVYDADCVIDDGADGVYPKGSGTVFVIDGTFGRGLYAVNAADSEAPYFAKIDSSSWGFMRYTVTPDRIDAQFVTTSGTFSDTFSIRVG